jgi:hypothetical protein
MEMSEGREPTGMGADRSTGENIKAKAHEAQEKVSEVAADLKDRGEDLVEEGKEMGRDLADRAGEAARSRADEEKDRVCGGMRAVANALRRGSDDLPEDQRMYGRFLEGVADRVAGASRYLDERDVSTLAGDVKRIARDHSAAFLGGAFVLGMVGARFLKSSPDQARSARDSHYGDPRYGDARYGDPLYGQDRPRGLSEPGMTGSPRSAQRPPEQRLPEPRGLSDRSYGTDDPLEGGRDARGI